MIEIKDPGVERSIIEYVKKTEISAIENLPMDNAYADVASLLVKCSQNGGKVAVLGVGKAHSVGQRLAITLNSVKVSSLFIDPHSVMFGNSGQLSNKDVLILLDNTGMNPVLHEALDLIHNQAPKAKMVLICGALDSYLGKTADHVIWTGNPTESCILGLTPTSSMISMSVIINILFVMIQKITNYSVEDFSALYPTKYLEHKSMQNELSLIGLKNKEISIINMLAMGATLKEIAKEYGLTLSGVKYHTNSIYKKLSAANKSEAISKAAALNLIKGAAV